jgi:hypothetical protein
MQFKVLGKIVAFSAVLAAKVSFAAIATTATVYMHSDPGSWVGGGLESTGVTWEHGVDGIFYGSAFNYYGTDHANGVTISYNGDSNWTFEFAAPTYNPATNTNNGQVLTTGYYANASRYPFNSPTKPGLDISGDGRGNNTLSGWFNVLDIGYDSNGELSTFAVDFAQFGETRNSTGPGLYGSLRFNSTIPISAVPELETYIMFFAGLGLVGLASQRRKGDAAQNLNIEALAA